MDLQGACGVEGAPGPTGQHGLYTIKSAGLEVGWTAKVVKKKKS